MRRGGAPAKGARAVLRCAGTRRRRDGASAPYERFAKQNLGSALALPERSNQIKGAPKRAKGPFGDGGVLWTG